MEISDYTQREVTVGGIEANIKGTLFGSPAIVIFGLPFILLWKDALKAGSILPHFNLSFLFFAFIIIGTVLHELIHGIFWSFFIEKGFKSIKFGVMWKVLTPYCHSKEPMKIKHYLIGAIMPALLLGFIPSLIALVIGDFIFLVFGIFFSVAAGGDFLMIWMLRNEDMNGYVQDHPAKVGCYVYDKIK